MSQGLCFFDEEQRLIVCNRKYLEIYVLDPDVIRPGMKLNDIVDLRYSAGSAPKMSKQDYLVWRNSARVIAESSDTTVELTSGRIVRIRHRPMEGRGWVATHEDITERHRIEMALAETKAAAEQAEAAARAAHTHLTEALDVVPEGLAVFDKDDRLVLWNRQYANFYAASQEALAAGAPFESILRAGLARGQYPKAIGREDEWLAERLARHALPRYSHEQHLPDDRWIRVEERRTADGGSIGVRIDITDLKRREASFRLLFEENPLPMWVVDTATRQLLAVNAAMCRHYGYRRENLLLMCEPQLECGASDGSADFELHRTACGDLIQMVIESRPLHYEGHSAHVCVAFDVTERNRAQERISYLASHDVLTELPNRSALDQHLTAAVERHEITGSGFALLCIDLDHFKEINDLFGHAVGDAVLRETSRRLQEAAQGCYVARMGGDEFIGITDQVPLSANAELLATKMRAAFEDPIEVEVILSSWISASARRCFPEMRITSFLCSRTRMRRSIGPSTRAGARSGCSRARWTSSSASAARSSMICGSPWSAGSSIWIISLSSTAMGTLPATRPSFAGAIPIAESSLPENSSQSRSGVARLPRSTTGC
jgi:diguanylate cyclase (GGDEF)-like protein